MLEINKIYCMDALEFLKQMPDQSVDLVLTDPPYNASNSNIEFPDKHWKSISEEWDKDFKIDFMYEVERVLRLGGSCIVFCSYHTLKQYLNFEKLKLQQILHWVKDNPVPAFMKVYTYSCEYALWYVKKGRPYTFNKQFAKTNVIKTPMKDKGVNRYHPCQKTYSIIRPLLQVHSNEGDLILDCFIGSGTTAVVSKQLKRSFIGCDISQEYCKIAEKRVRQQSILTCGLMGVLTENTKL
jgi:DNA modification methylase